MKKLIAWVEIPSTDFDRCVEFYEKILALSLKSRDYGTEKMACLPGDEGAIIYAPGYNPSDQGVIVSLAVNENLDNTLQLVESAGGRILKGNRQKNQEISLTELAYQCGYYDQSHMINDFRTLSGLTPGEYFADCDFHSDYFSL